MSRLSALTVLAFVGAVFLGAFLSFAVEPMAGKLLLPRYGGSPAVWNTVLVFFQLLLLAGYAYAHASVTRLAPSGQHRLHLAVVAAAAVFLPPMLRTAPPPATQWPIASVLVTLALAVAAPFFALAATSTFVQSWYAAGDRSSRRDPYWLYAASNLGSLLGLLAYPVLIEPNFDLAAQGRAWAAGYIIYALLVAALGRSLGRRTDLPLAEPIAAPVDRPAGRPPASEVPAGRGDRSADLVTRRRIWGWILRPAVASSLLLAVTTHITTDVAAVPLLWIIPLSLYIVTFILAFSHPITRWRGLLTGAAGLCMAVVVGALLLERSLGLAWQLGADLAVLFFGAWALHNDLAADRPSVEALSRYYLAVSLGGAIGGVLNSLVAPLIFRSVMEYPITVAALVWLVAGSGAIGASGPETGRRGDSPARPAASWRPKLRLLAIAGSMAVFAVSIIGFRAGWPVAALLPMPFLLLAGGLALLWVRDVYRVAVTLAIVMLMLAQSQAYPQLDQGRSFFGVLRVSDSDGLRLLVHGTTVHGAQHTVGDRREALTYYHVDGPLAKGVEAQGDEARMAIVGLGAGSLATYGRPSQHMDFYEIDPLVERMARRHFSFLADSPAKLRVILGDARLRLTEVADGTYDLILVDAFSGDAIPVHLLTREAVDLYFSKLKPRGIVVLHLSNRYLDFLPVLRALAHDGRYHVISSLFEATQADRDKVHWSVHGVAIARGEADLAPLIVDRSWRPIDAGREVPWTDSFSNVLGLMRGVVLAP